MDKVNRSCPDSFRIAEWLLSQVVASERAASTVGDLMEEVPARGRFWFWSCVARTVSSSAVRDFRAIPVDSAGLALRAILVNQALCILFMLPCTYVVFLLPLFAENLLHIPLPHPSLSFNLVGGACYLASSCLTGKWIARRSPGSEFTGCVTFCAIQATLFALLAMMRIHVNGMDVFPFNVLAYLSVFAGALKTRGQSLRSPVS